MSAQEAKFCPDCGRPTVEPADSPYSYCENCQKHIHPLNIGESSTVPPPLADRPPREADELFCPRCGHRTVRTASSPNPYCENCHRYVSLLRETAYREPELSRLSGIRGWLILPAIGVVINPILLLMGIVASFETFGEYDWVIDAYPVLRAILTVDIVGAVIVLILFIVLLFFFFGKRRSAPSLFIWTSVISIGFAVITTLMSTSLWGEFPGYAAETLPSTIGSIVASVLWIAYFTVSKRVAATFVN